MAIVQELVKQQQQKTSKNTSVASASHMSNTLFSYPTTTSFGSYTVSDIFERKITLANVSLEIPKAWVGELALDSGRRLEEIATSLYGNPSYWDVLYVVNNMDNVFDLPKSDDYVISVVDKYIEEWIKQFPNTPIQRLEKIKEEIMETETKKNEKHRNFKYILPQFLPKFQDLFNNALQTV